MKGASATTVDALTTCERVRKVISYLRLYGPGRVWFKVAGRMRLRGFGWGGRSSRIAGNIGVIGCGQFAFATMGYHIHTSSVGRFAACYDVAAHAAETFAAFYRITRCTSAEELLQMPAIHHVYIASNHASHAPYAIHALRAGKTVFIEKPIAVTRTQLEELSQAIKSTDGKIFAGYNRPFSRAVQQLKHLCTGQQGPLTLGCFVSGHKLDKDHWYRHPHEGTRICGNVGHWLDLAVHILSWGRLPTDWTINLAWSDETSKDDDLSISLTSARGDLVVIVLTARCEPFEGINETINVQWGNVIAKIDDFRRMELWQHPKRWTWRYWPKDVGHRGSLLQPFAAPQRDWREVELSSLLMLHVAEMVKEGRHCEKFRFPQQQAAQGSCLDFAG